jgi:hypothetical protein
VCRSVVNTDGASGSDHCCCISFLLCYSHLVTSTRAKGLPAWHLIFINSWLAAPSTRQIVTSGLHDRGPSQLMTVLPMSIAVLYCIG